MAEQFAKIIIDISHEKVDKTFEYKIPSDLSEKILVGTQVVVPFGKGNTVRKGYVVEVTDTLSFDYNKVKSISGIVKGSTSAESHLIQLAWWMKEKYGSTMNQALKTVLPVKQKIKSREKKTITCLLSSEDLDAALLEAEKKNYKSRIRLFECLRKTPVVDYDFLKDHLNISTAGLKPLIEKGQIRVVSETIFRNPVQGIEKQDNNIILNQQQRQIVEKFCSDYQQMIRTVYLLHGVTGSGKTQVYMELISHVLKEGKQVIVLIPEIALTYQTVQRFYNYFGNQVSILNSRLSQGERYDQFERAKKGEISIMIGPRSALFTPFHNLGLIIIDEEHENAYKSETIPRYHARETAIYQAGIYSASVVLGSATPSLESYSRALKGEYQLFQLNQRAKADSEMAVVEIVDLKKEMQEGNKSVFSRMLQEKIIQRLEEKQQIMLFINRRGYSSFISCRSCGEAIKCPHCDVTLTLHKTGKMICHYCGFQMDEPKACPNCSSPYIAGFGVGTQKIETMTKAMFPKARVLRMDLDTTSGKHGHTQILSQFSKGEADILIGTQMIVKGHDFPNVTLVGILAADLSLYSSDYRSGEKTFQLLTQAAGRAGRDQLKGEVVIQTYNPEHYSITTAASQDYNSFYQKEIAYRTMMKYPPVKEMLLIQLSSSKEQELINCINQLHHQLTGWEGHGVDIIGPVDAPVYKVNDIYRKNLYMKHENCDILIKIRNQTEEYTENNEQFRFILTQYDFL